METDDNSSGALGAGEHGGGSHQLQSPGSNPLGVGQGSNAAEGYVAKYAAKEDTKVNRSLSAAEGCCERRHKDESIPIGRGNVELTISFLQWRSRKAGSARSAWRRGEMLN